MATIWIPSLLRNLTGGVSEVNVPGETVREIIDRLEEQYPGIKDRLCDEERIRPNIAVVVDGIRCRQGLRQRVDETSEVHFVPAISGGADVLRVYISAAADLAFEREVISRAITEIPTTLAWRIVQTPLLAEEPDLAFLAQADVHLLLLGSDVRAPVGVEWLAARRADRMPLLLLKNMALQTQAAQAFMRELERYTTWHRFDGPTDLRKRVLTSLADHILSNHEHYQIGADEYEKIATWRKELKKAKQQHVDQTRGGAGDSSVIFSVERYVPSEGVLLNDPHEPAQTS